jgi:diguanylate cyclase (GGDEF)-like protein
MSSEDQTDEDRQGTAHWPRRKRRWRGWRATTIDTSDDTPSFDDYAAERLWSFLCAQLGTALFGYVAFVAGDIWLRHHSGHAAAGWPGVLSELGALPAMPIAAALVVAWSRRGALRASVAALVAIAALEAGLAWHVLQWGPHAQLLLPAFVLIPLTFSPVLLRGWDFAAATVLSMAGPLVLVQWGAPSAGERFGLILSMFVAICTSLVANLFALRSQKKSFRLEQQLRAFADMDELTQLPRRRRVFELGRRILQRAERHHQPFSVLYIDADHFKSVNDRFGHEAGDRALRLVSRAIQDGLRPNDVCGRFGGEEFVALLPNTDRDDAARVAERLRKRVEEMRQFEVALTISVGVAQHLPGEQIDRVIRRADAALLDAKGSGRNRVVIAPHPSDTDPTAGIAKDASRVSGAPREAQTAIQRQELAAE